MTKDPLIEPVAMTKKERIERLEDFVGVGNDDIFTVSLQEQLHRLLRRLEALEAWRDDVKTLTDTPARLDELEERIEANRVDNTFLEWVKIKNAKGEKANAEPEAPQDPDPPRCPECGKGETEGLYFENEACFFTCVCGYKQRDWGSRREAEAELRKRLGGV